jgi:hypothetical protein
VRVGFGINSPSTERRNNSTDGLASLRMPEFWSG